jgi:hypothetical protein
MRNAVEQIDLLDYSLIDIVGASGLPAMLLEKGAAGCQVRALIGAPDSIWVAAAAKQLGQDDQDYISRTELEREIELSRGHLEPLIGKPGIEIRAFYAERYNTIVRFDDQMLVTLHLWGTPTAQAPLLHLRRHADGGLFDQFAHHLETIIREASEPVDPDPDLYPDPNQNPDRYKPTTKESYEQQKKAVQWDPPKRTWPKQPTGKESGDELRSYLDRLADSSSD